MKYKVLFLLMFIFKAHASGTVASAIMGQKSLHFDFEKRTLSCPQSTLDQENPDIIFIGENHFDPLAAEFISKNVQHFKSMGFNHIFVEYIESRDQYVLDNFNENPVENLNQLYRTFGMEGDWGYDTNKYLNLSVYIAHAGINLMGLDRRFDLMFMRDQDEKMKIRDQHMFDIAKDFIKRNPGEKLIFFNGWAHSFKNDQLTGKSFYELFKDYFTELNIVNLKKDYYEEISKERLKIAEKQPILNENCRSEFVLYTSESTDDFDYYIFENNEPLFPVSDRYTSDFI